MTRLGSWGPPLHLVLATLAVIALIVAPANLASVRIETVPPVLDLIRILFVLIGLPALVLTTTTPLVSGWFEAAREREVVGDPYWLYALSNGGSLLALHRLPAGHRTASRAWRAARGLGGRLRASSSCSSRSPLRAPSRRSALASPRRPPMPRVARASACGRSGLAIDWRRRGRWLLLAAVPSGLLSAVTMFISTDLVSAPLLWVAPLSIYLVTLHHRVLASWPALDRARRRWRRPR